MPSRHGPVVNHVAREEEVQRPERVVKINPVGSKGIHINCQLNGVPVDALLDTGSDYTLVSDRLYPKLVETRVGLDQCHLSGVQTATGEPVSLLGQFPCRLQTRSLNLITDVIVVKDLKLECLLGQNVAEHLPGYPSFLNSIMNESLAVDRSLVPNRDRNIIHALLYAPPDLTDKYLKSFLEHHESIFSQSVEDLTGTDIVEHDIVLSSDTTIKEPMRRIPYHLRAEVEKGPSAIFSKPASLSRVSQTGLFRWSSSARRQVKSASASTIEASTPSRSETSIRSLV